jgi:hypothetical protein
VGRYERFADCAEQVSVPLQALCLIVGGAGIPAVKEKDRGHHGVPLVVGLGSSLLKPVPEKFSG